MDASAQTFWLENLKRANHYNAWIFSQLLPHLGQDVLEVGCGNGNFTQLLAQQCSKVVAIDINEEYVNLAKARLEGTGVEIFVADAAQIQPQPVDTVVMLDVLEHIEDDGQMLRHLSTCLKPGGKLIVKVPACLWLYSSLDAAIGHCRRYSKRAIASVCEQAHFSPPLVWFFNAAGIPGWWLNGRLGRTTASPHQVELFDRVVPLLRMLEARVKPPLGLSLFAVATKRSPSQPYSP